MTNGNTIIEFIENSHGGVFEAFCEHKNIDLKALTDEQIDNLQTTKMFMDYATQMHSEGE
jgi:hypothetical protein